MAGDPRYPVRFTPTFAGMQGSQMIAAYINLFLYGLALFMVVHYFRRNGKNDSIVVKGVIMSLIFLSTLGTIFTCHQSYDTLISKQGKPQLYDVIAVSVPGKYACVYLTAFISQMFFGGQIWSAAKSSGNKLRFMVIPVILTSILSAAAGFILVVLEAHYKSFMKLSLDTRILLIANNLNGGASALCDILISMTLIAILLSHRSGVERSDYASSKKLITYAVSRAVVTSILALLGVFLYSYASGTYYFMIPVLANMHIYVIFAVSIPTAKEGLRQGLSQPFHISNLALMGSAKSNKSETTSLEDEKV